jgi:hypothetical protein
VSDPDPEVLAYEPPPPADPPSDGISVTDYGDSLVITGPRPRPWSVTRIVLCAVGVAAWLGWNVYHVGLHRGSWRFGPDVVFFTLLFTGSLLLPFGVAWRARRPRVTEVTPDGVSVTDHLSLDGWVRYPRHRIRCMNLVHDDLTRPDGTRASTLRLVLRPKRGALPPLFGEGKGVVILTGPAPHLREIGDRIRQVLDHQRPGGE